MTNLFSPKLGCASSKNHPINSQCLWCFIPIRRKENGHHGNKMNFYLFSNSKKTLFRYFRPMQQTPSICKILKYFNIFSKLFFNKKQNVAKDIPLKNSSFLVLPTSTTKIII
jgi:hypothetical protein